jgi:hypothetical protein
MVAAADCWDIQAAGRGRLIHPCACKAAALHWGKTPQRN